MKGSFIRSLREEAQGQGGGEFQGNPGKMRLHRSPGHSTLNKQHRREEKKKKKKKTDCEISSDGFSHLARAEAAATFLLSSVDTAPDTMCFLGITAAYLF